MIGNRGLIIPFPIKNFIIDDAKAPGLIDCEVVNIKNIDHFTIDQSRELSLSPIMKFFTGNGIMIKIYDSTTIDQIVWPETEEGALAKRHLQVLMKEGPETFIQNARTQLFVLTLDNLIIPITVNDAEYHNCYLLSSYFVVANLEEKMNKSALWFKLCSKPVLTLFSSLLKWMQINKVVIINNWLFTTNPYPEISQSQMTSITNFLKQQFPDHYFMFRSVNNYANSDVYDALSTAQFRLIPCRHVYLYDPSRQMTPTILRKQKKDTNRIAHKKYTVETVNSLTDGEIERLLQLYINVYVGKYTKYSPLYTEKFLKHGLQSNTLRIKLLKKGQEIYGVAGFLEKNDYLLVPFFGYDTSVSQEEGLYRMLSAVIMKEIEICNKISHQGSGAAQFKKWRGFIEELEYVGIYDRHLSWKRRTFWSLSEKFSSRFVHAPPSQELPPENNQD